MNQPKPVVSWKRNLAILWIAQVVTTLGFSFTFPFFPIFFQELGIEETERAAFWAGASGWVFGIGMGLFAPIWGIVGDRFGRKLNVVRAMLLGALFLVLAGYSQTPMQLFIVRFFIGVTSGVMPAIMALVTAHTPRERTAFATGATMSALFFGTAMGPLFGGIIFDNFGMRAAFWATGIALAVAAFMVIFLVRENFQRPVREGQRPLQPFIDLWRMATARAFLPLLFIIVLVHVVHLIIMPTLPGIVDGLHASDSSATVAGAVFMVVGAASAMSSMLMGWLGGRVGVRLVFMFAASAAILLNLPPYFAGTLLLFTLTVFAANLVAGGLAGLANGMVALSAPREQQGAAFGASQAAASLGIAFGPLLGGSAAVAFGLRSVFLVNIALFVVILACAFLLLRELGQRASPEAGTGSEHERPES